MSGFTIPQIEDLPDGRARFLEPSFPLFWSWGESCERHIETRKFASVEEMQAAGWVYPIRSWVVCVSRGSAERLLKVWSEDQSTEREGVADALRFAAKESPGMADVFDRMAEAIDPEVKDAGDR